MCKEDWEEAVKCHKNTVDFSGYRAQVIHFLLGQDDAPLVQMRAKLSQLKTEAILNSSCNENQSQSNSLQRCGNNCLLSSALLMDLARHGCGQVIGSTAVDIECFILYIHFISISCTPRNLEFQHYEFHIWHCSAEQRPKLLWRHGQRMSGDQTVKCFVHFVLITTKCECK